MRRRLVLAAIPSFLSALAAQGWVDCTPGNPLQRPTPRAFARACWDGAHGYVLLFGGWHTGAPDETWSWDGTAWTRRVTPTTPPATAQPDYQPRNAMAFHPPSNQVMLVCDGSTWFWTGTTWLSHPASVPSTPGLPPNPGNVAMAHDPVHGETVLYVGTRYGSGSFPVATSETYLWNGFAWIRQPTATNPWPVEQPTLAYDPVAGRLVLGTNGGGGAAFHEWTGTNWQQRLPAGAPAATGSFATDTAHQRLVMLDGVLNAQPHHTWTLADGVVQQLATPLEPARRVGAAMAYDPVRQRIVMFGGAAAWTFTPTGSTVWPIGDTWELDLPAGASYTPFGTGCLGSRGVPTLAASFGATPRVGQVFQAVTTNLPLQGPAFMFLGLSNTTYGALALPLSLAGLGAPGCAVLCSGDDLGVVTNVLGTGLWQWPVPNVPGASFYNQCFVFDAAANPLGITASNAAHGVIGF